MSEHNKRLARRALEEIYAKGNLEHLQGAFGGLRFEVEDEIAEGDKVVQLVVMSGRHTGSLMGREPTGREFAVRHTNIWRIADDRIVDHWGSRDDLGLLGQLGLVRMGEA